MKKIILILSIAGILFSCNQQVADQSVRAEKEIMLADQAMSDLASQQGFSSALYQYADSELVKFSDRSLPIIGKAAYADSIKGKNGTKDLSWSPVRAWAARSGDIGFSWGNWKFVKPDTIYYGCYFTAWKKHKDGSWKWVIDGGNDTPAPRVK